jgi:glycosyltransferase involved in cell wall biosynthesis
MKTNTSGRLPAASVLMAVYNERPEFLDCALASIAAQTMSDFEVVLVDDGTTAERTIEVMAAWTARDSRIRLLRTANQGLTRALNFGLQHCQAEVILRHDSDDWSAPQRFAAQIEFLSTHPECDLIGAAYQLCAENGAELMACSLPASHADVQQAFASGRSPFCHGAVCFRRARVISLGGYRETLPCAQDYDLFWRVSERGVTGNLKAVLYWHRRTGAAISARRTQLQDVCVRCIQELARMRAQDGREDFAAAWTTATTLHAGERQRSRSLMRQADHLMLAGHYLRAAQLYGRQVLLAGLAFAPLLKLVRLVIFATCPALRPALFRRRAA